MANPPTAGNAKKIGRVGRKRRIAGWMLLLLGLLVAAVWVASGWWRISYANDFGDRGVEFHDGAVEWRSGWMYSIPPGSSVRGTDANQANWRYWLNWGAHSQRLGNGSVDQRAMGVLYSIADSRSANVTVTSVWVLLWPIPLLLWTPAALLLRSGILARRRAMTGSCAKCGYSLAGLAADAPCPECGKGAETT